MQASPTSRRKSRAHRPVNQPFACGKKKMVAPLLFARVSD